MHEGVRRVLAGAEILSVPMADGGEGSLDILLKACGGERRCSKLPGVDGVFRSVDWGVIRLHKDEKQAVIEVAQIAGIASAGTTPVERRSSEGVGLLMARCLDIGIRRFLICLGGSSINDGGAGLLSTLGLSLLSDSGRRIHPNLGGLADLTQIDDAGLDRRLKSCEIKLICDVDNPLFGPEGATQMYGPQKGIRQDKMAEYDARLQHFAGLCEQCIGIFSSGLAGAGAAGGLGFALQLLGAKYYSGAAMMAELLDLDAVMENADLVLTGEGKTDAQTLRGKVAYEVARRASRLGSPVALISGSVDRGVDGLENVFNHICAVTPAHMSMEEAATHAKTLISEAAEQVALKHLGVDR